MNEWISAMQRLPEPGERVLLISQSWQSPEIVRYHPTWLGGGPKFVQSFRGEELSYWYPERMHWMPLPSPPPSTPKQGEGE